MRENAKRKTSFLGMPVIKQTPLKASDAAQLAERLGRNTSYVDGDIGCVSESVGFRLSRGDAHLDFIHNCGHGGFIEGDLHGAIFASDMIAFLDRLAR